MEAKEAFRWRMDRTICAWICLRWRSDVQAFSREAAPSALLLGWFLVTVVGLISSHFSKISKFVGLTGL